MVLDDREMTMMPRQEVPPDFELRIARAKKRHRENNAHLSEIVTLFKSKFLLATPLDDAFISGVNTHIAAVIFFKKDSDIAECESNGTSQQMRDFIYDKLEEFGRGKRGEIGVVFVFDSFENVERNYEGSYFLRMR
jgi:hypothetical protein